MKFTPRDRLIVALDTDNLDSAKKIVGQLGDSVSIYKVGIQLFTAVGPEILDWLAKKKKKVFLDLKFHDIPRSVAQAGVSVLKKNVFMFNLHLAGGEAMIKETVKKVREFSKKQGKKPPLIIGVTVLTSLVGEDLKRMGIDRDLSSLVLELASLGKRAGLDGVVASAREAKTIKEKLGGDFLVVTPGIRPSKASFDDQKRITTPKEAIASGADFLVVGRPITQSVDPVKSAKEILLELERAQDAY